MRNVRVVTVGASNAGPKSNITPDRAELLLNVRTYDTAVRKRVIASIERIVRGECAAEAVQEATPATASDRGLSYEIFRCGSGIRSRS